MRAPAWDELVIVVAEASWDGNWLPSRHLAHHLSQRIPVLWVDPPMSWLTPLRNRASLKTLREDRIRQVADNIVRVTPVTVPGVTRPIARDVSIRQSRRAVRRAVDALGATVRGTVVTTLEDMLDVVPSGVRVFYGTDDYVAGAELMGMDAGWLARAETRQLAKADRVVAMSPVLQDKWSARRPDVTMIPNGCEAAHFLAVDEAPLPADVRLAGPIAGFVGYLNDRIDLRLLEALAATGASLLVVGPCAPTFEIARMQALFERPNVQWVGPKDFAELPSYLRVIDVGLTPYGLTDFNRASFPLKTLEYLAAGRPVVATDLPAHRWLDTPHVTIADGPEAFAAAACARLDAPRDARDVADRQALAGRHTWAARTAELARVIGLDDGTAAAAPVAA